MSPPMRAEAWELQVLGAVEGRQQTVATMRQLKPQYGLSGQLRCGEGGWC